MEEERRRRGVVALGRDEGLIGLEQHAQQDERLRRDLSLPLKHFDKVCA